MESRERPQQAAPLQNIMVDNPGNDVDGHTHSETSIAVNGSTIIEAFNDAYDANDSGYAVSTDAGNTWTARRVPVPAGLVGLNLGDPVVAFGPSGEIYYSMVSLVLTAPTDIEFIATVAKSTDNGLSFSQPVNASTTAGNPNDLQDKPWVTVDRGGSSKFKGRVYLSWTDVTRFGAGSFFINVARSTDGGATFSKPVAVSPADKNSAATGSVPVVAPNGDVYVAYEDFDLEPGGISIVKSTDGGVTFSGPKAVARFFPIGTLTGGGGVRTNSFPSMTVDNNGVVHIVFNAITHPPGPDRSDIYYVRSGDGGNTFSPPQMLNDDGTATSQNLPSIVAAPDGTLAAKWWDRRNDPTRDLLTDVYMAISRDGGQTWSKNFRITDHNWVFGPTEGLSSYHGDYDSIAADSSNFYVSWSDERAAFPNAFFALVPIDQNPAFADFNISATKVFDSVIAGNSTEFDLSTSASNGFSGALALSVTTPPANGMTFTFAGATVMAGEPAKLTVSTSPATQRGTYLLTVAAAGAGLTRRTNFRLTVYDPARTAAPVNVTNTSGFSSEHYGLQIDSSGSIHVTFDDDTAIPGGSDVFYSRSTDAGHTFSRAVKISTNSDFSFQSTEGLDGTGGIYVAWTSLDTNTGNQEVFLSRSTDHGLSFSTPAMASSGSQYAVTPRIAIDRNGNVVLVYIDFNTANFSIWAVRSSDGGRTFSGPVQISGNKEDVGSLGQAVAFDSAGAAYVVYSDDAAATTPVRFAAAPDGLHVGGSATVSDGQSDAFAPSIAVSRNDEICVAFESVTGSVLHPNEEIMFVKSCDKGAAFSGQVNVSSNPGQSTSPGIAVGADGVISLAWEDTTDKPDGDVFVSRSVDGGATFTPAFNLSADSGQASSACLAIDPAGDVFSAWTDDSAAERDVFLALLPPPPPPGATGFGLVVSPAVLNVARGDQGTVKVFVGKTGGFNGNVTVSPVNGAAIKLKIKPASVATSCLSASFTIKVKASAPIGLHTLTFSGTDDKGNVQSASIVIDVL